MSRTGQLALAQVVGGLYEAAHEPELWPASVERLRLLFNGSKACFARSGPKLTPADAVATDFDLDMQLKLCEWSDGSNDLANAIWRAPVGAVYSEEDLVGAEGLKRSPFWNEWMAPQDMYGGLATKVMASDSSFWFFDVQRGRRQRKFDASERRLFSLIVPHLQRAAEIGRAVQQSRSLTSALASLPIGAVQLSGQLRIAASNQAALTILSRPDSLLKEQDGRLVTTCRKHDGALGAFLSAHRVADSMRTAGELRLQAEAGTIDLVLSISPARSGSDGPFEDGPVVFIREAALTLRPGSAEHLQKAFGLTAAEARLAAALASGASLKQAAEASSLRFSTVRTYLERILRKTGTRQQSQLVALIRTEQPLFAPSRDVS